ncbi:hypothetical protein BpHYR1_017040 [Brachionus plicatilis]|uniref:Uncharacterized protein n=1 Tax=Brachionus plicatilis TaxID=10195 RepID=A0A3M7SQ94_BRAPC|nr:hypothetical protein BpHYR1_017040 [Brachionus plicatilis]
MVSSSCSGLRGSAGLADAAGVPDADDAVYWSMTDATRSVRLGRDDFLAARLAGSLASDDWLEFSCDLASDHLLSALLPPSLRNASILFATSYSKCSSTLAMSWSLRFCTTSFTSPIFLLTLGCLSTLALMLIEDIFR